jgi:aspartate aminotransferase-like enzyme
MYKKLFIPGPTHVREEILGAQTAPMIGHRSKDYSALQAAVSPKLKQLLYTEQPVFMYASSGTGLMEGSLRQGVQKRALVTVCGAFSERWYEIAVANGVPTDRLDVDLGKGFTPEMVDEALSKADYDVLTLTFNETATGVMNPVKEIAALVRQKYPDVLILVDAVSAMAGQRSSSMPGESMCLCQLAEVLCAAPGLAIAAVSERAFKRAEQIPNRGYYFDYLTMLKSYKKDQTPATPQSA